MIIMKIKTKVTSIQENIYQILCKFLLFDGKTQSPISAHRQWCFPLVLHSWLCACNIYNVNYHHTIFRTRTQTAEDISILCQQHILGENQQNWSYLRKNISINQEMISFCKSTNVIKSFEDILHTKEFESLKFHF